MKGFNTGPSPVWIDEPKPGTPVFIMRGLITEIPPELEVMDDKAAVVVAMHTEGPIPGFPAGYWKQVYRSVIDRHLEGKFNAPEVASILAEQQGVMSNSCHLLQKVHEGYKKGWLKFFWPDGTPYDDYAEGKSDPYHRSLQNMYTTAEYVNLWLEKWGAKYRFSGKSDAQEPSEKVEPIKSKSPADQTQKRRNILDPIIEKAMAQCSNPFDAHDVWTKLCEMARAQTPPHPLIGITESGIKWLNPKDDIRELTFAALKKRVERKETRTAKKIIPARPVNGR